MGTFRVQLPTTGSLEESLSKMPAHLKTFLRDGFNTLLKIPPANMDEFVGIVLESVQSGLSMTDESTLSQFSVSRDDARALLGSASLMASLLSTRQETAEQFVNASINLNMIDPAAKGIALVFLTGVVKNRLPFSRAIEHSKLASEVLPSLHSLQVAVDLRLGFEKGKITNSVPVAVVHFDTDAENTEIWFQMSKRQLERVVKDLEGALRKIEQVEKWASDNTATKEQ